MANTFRIERLEDCEELSIRCLETGTFVRFVLAEAQGGTFIDGEAGMEPPSIPNGSGTPSPASAGSAPGLTKSLDAIREIAQRER